MQFNKKMNKKSKSRPNIQTKNQINMWLVFVPIMQTAESLFFKHHGTFYVKSSGLGKNPVFFEKTQPTRVFWKNPGFIGFYWAFWVISISGSILYFYTFHFSKHISLLFIIYFMTFIQYIWWCFNCQSKQITRYEFSKLILKTN